MNGSPLLLFRLLPLGGLAISAAVLGCLIIELWATNIPAGRDDWRRTADGWERASHWPKAPATQERNLHANAPSDQPSFRFDSHPAALALGQLTAVLLALFALPGTKRRGEIGLVSGIARSFRASFFGS